MGILARIGGLAAVLACLPVAGGAQPYGIETRAPNETLLIAEPPPTTTQPMTTQVAFPNLRFTQPLLLLDAPDGLDRFFVLEKTGRVQVFPNRSTATATDRQVFLDLSGVLATSSEQGLLGMAFDPDYAVNGEFYVFYSYRSSPSVSLGVSRLSRFTNNNPQDSSAERASEEVILEIPQPFTNHKGGMIAFGPDGMLYIGTGDGGSSNDPQNNAQDTASLLGKMLRIDVRGTPDAGLAYRIPPDNPFVSGGPAGTSTRKEIWAYGLRNPWRWSFDAVRGYLLAGDVGQDAVEEISHVRRGENYGWKIREGSICRPGGANPCQSAGLTPPIHEYAQTSARGSVTGGYVYYGTAQPSLYGRYLFADYLSGEVFAINYDGSTASAATVLVDTTMSIAGFGQDERGEVYVIDIGGGAIHRLIPSGGGTPSTFPTRLSALPALLTAGLGEGHTVPGVLPYQPVAEFWSDGARKTRYAALPGLARATETVTDGWDFPSGTVLIKNFTFPKDARVPDGEQIRLETRLLYRFDTQWYAYSYEWNAAGTDAVLLPDSKRRTFTTIEADGSERQRQWYFPSSNECFRCHTAQANVVLGLSTAQMNGPFRYPASGVTDNQLRTLDHLQFFTSALSRPVDQLPRMVDPHDPAAGSLDERARSYLAANCSMCHRPSGTAPTDFDVRWETATTAAGLINAVPLGGTFGVQPPALLVAPGLPASSVLLERISRLDAATMPPLPRDAVDEEGKALIAAWIVSLAATPTPTATPSPTASPTATATPTTTATPSSTPSPTAAPPEDVAGMLLGLRNASLLGDGNGDALLDAADLIPRP